MKWSVHGQTPLYLAMSRMATLAPAVMDQIMTRIPLEPGMRVLDVGCGSGEFTFRLAERSKGAHFTGVDFDQGFVDCCQARVEGREIDPLTPAPTGNDYAFLQADGMALPFRDGSFDLVVGHTYLTALPDYYGALQEMMRVCAPGGLVASITSMGDAYDRLGTMDLLPPVLSPQDAPVVDRVRGCMRALDPSMDMRSGVPKGKVQLTFQRVGLEQVSALPLGQYLSLSDANLPAGEYHRYVDLLYAVEAESAQAAQAALETRAVKPAAAGQPLDETPLKSADAPSAQDWEHYYELLERRREQLHQIQGSNHEWAWHGSAAILVTGRMPQGTPASSSLARALEVEPRALQEARQLELGARRAGLEARQTTVQTACGRACAVRLEMPEESVAFARGRAHDQSPEVWGAGFTPSQAQAHAWGLALGQLMEGEGDAASGLSAVRGGTTPVLAGIEAACAALEKLVLRHLSQEQPALPPAHEHQVYGVAGMFDTAYDCIAQGCQLEFFDASLGLGIPAMACRCTGGGKESWGLASYPGLSVVAQRACARALATLAGAPSCSLPVAGEADTAPNWEAPLWADDPASPEQAWELLEQTFAYLDVTATFEDVPAPSATGPKLAFARCTLAP